MAGAGGNVSDGDVEKSIVSAATTETINPSSGGSNTPPLAAASAGQDDLIPQLTEQSPLSPIPCPTSPSETFVGPTLPPNPTTPLKSTASGQDGAVTTPPCTLPAPSDPIFSDSTIPSGSAASTPPCTDPGPSDPTLPEPSDGENDNQSKTGEDDSSLVLAEETVDISAQPSGCAAGSSTLNATTLVISQPTPAINKPTADPDGIRRRPRSKRGRPQEPLTFGANKQEAIHNQPQAPPPPTPAATLPREGTTVTVQDERTPPPPPTKRIKNGKGIGSSSSSAGHDSPPPPSPVDAANSDSQVLRNRKDKDGNVRWYFSSAGASSSRKGSHLLIHPPPPLPLQPPVQGPQLPYPCSICGRGFYSLRSLCGHMKAHPGRQWRGAFPPPDNLFPVLALPVSGAEDEDDGDEAGKDFENIDGELVDQGEMRQPSPEGNNEEQAQAAAVPPAREDEDAAGGGKNPLRWDLNGPPPTESDEDMLGDDR